MGTDLGELIEPREISFEHMLNKEIAVDAMNTMYQFLSIIRQPTGDPLKDSDGNITSHLSGMFYRNGKLIRKGIKPVYVFDGKAPDLKSREAKERRKKREQAEEEWKKLKEEGKMKKAFQKATQSSKMTGEMIEEAKKLLDALGIPWIQAPSEGEAQAAWLEQEKGLWAVGSQDWDALLFGTDRLVRNLTTTGKRKIQGKDAYREVVPEEIKRDNVLKDLDVTQDKLIWLAILVGTDFNPGGVHGIGPKRGLDLVSTHDTFEELLDDDKVTWDDENDPHEILAFFKNPPIDTEVSYKRGDPNPDQVKEVLVEQHDFSEERVTSTLEKIMDSLEDTQQDLGSFV